MSKSARPRQRNVELPPRRATVSTPMPAPHQPLAPLVLTLLLLLIVVVRLTLTESLRDPLATRIADAAMSDVSSTVAAPGPGVTAGFALGVGALTGIALLLKRPTKLQWITLTLIGAIAALAACSAWHSPASQFVAAVGAFDLSAALLAGFTFWLLADDARARRWLIALLLALLAATTLRGLIQKFSDIPDTIDFFHTHLAEMMQAHHWTADDPAYKLFVGRMNSQEVGAYLTYANSLAAELIPLLLIGGALGALALLNRKPTSPFDETDPDSPERSRIAQIRIALGIALLLLTAAGIAVLIYTQSKGGNAAFVIAVIFGALLLVNGQRLSRHWRGFASAVMIVFALGAAAVVTYGVRHDALPTRSLRFRWDYWTTAPALVKQFPLLGVGLNNFGAFYTQYKKLAAPEDVIDPHSYFVRFATELGLPATILVLALILLLLVAGMRRLLTFPIGSDQPRGNLNRPIETSTLLALAGFMIAWWVLHFALGEASNVYSFLITAITAALAFFVFLIGWLVIEFNGQLRRALAAGLLGAIAMLVYDQVNMSLVTGPVAMLFWLLLAAPLSVGERHIPPTDLPHESSSTPLLSRATGGGLLIVIVSLAVMFWIPLISGTLSIDPRRDDASFLTATARGDYDAAAAALEHGLTLSPRSSEYLRYLIQVDLIRHQPVADLVRRALALDRTNIELRIDAARWDDGLTTAERLTALREAAHLDDILEKGEPKHLPAAQRQWVDQQIAAYEHTMTAPTSQR